MMKSISLKKHFDVEKTLVKKNVKKAARVKAEIIMAIMLIPAYSKPF